MVFIMKKYLLVLFLLFPNILFAYDCSDYAYNVDVDIVFDEGKTDIQKSKKDLDKELGFTKPEIKYSFLTKNVTIPVNDGYCVSLRGIIVNISENINITIDKRLKDNSCAYNIVLKHEQDHANVFKNVIKNDIDNIKQTLIKESKNIKPVFVKNEEDSPNFTEIIEKSDFKKKILSDIKNKIDSENKKIDERGDIYHIWKCDDFYKEWKDLNILID